ncbi:RpiR family transcriptional regulator [Companilactobacillus mindensis DSM 14500]|uniref:RpiR family transcriptional regulator n=1 Tax=Companilactobacillus mindensis DSM 14500 TaxID=1423770 RepID=A0A0R1QFI6_9LACO|nr:MurR/RpiR family transcriptional regulator [Companilactobacillus mindensis]KRL43606.1 RpiR family transcriptional regulator [Companilactobacillus mindensis DSM 14500]GEO78645.1 RpiR family transcriptional regulator [Companilactobacillus mindensis]
MQNIIDIIYNKLPHMSVTDKKIAEVVLKQPQQVIDYTISQLAKQSGVSDASVSRFCKNLNIDGFHQLKTRLAQVSDDANVSVTIDDDIQKSLKNISTNKSIEITNTLKNLSTKQITEVLKLIKNARLIQIVAEGNTYPVAIDAVYKFNQIGILAFSDAAFETSIAQTLNMVKQDILIIISNSGESKSLMKQLQVAQEKNIKVIAITNRNDSPIAQKADFHLKTYVREQIFQSEYYFSRIAASTMIEAIFLLLVGQDKETLKKISHHEELIADRKI